jgi:Sulfotransferase family
VPGTDRPAARRDGVRGKDSPYHVPIFLDILGGLVAHLPNFWIWLAGRESNHLAEQLRHVAIRKPIFICGLARSGSTLLHEVVCSHTGVGTHRSKDYPMVFTPHWWRQAIADQRPGPPRERSHQDGMMITTESPAALEEMLWMAFFPRCHDPAISNVFGAGDRRPAWESFYDLHIRKLLLAEKADRYAAKANYHVARLAYLARLFPDARFLIPVRAPADHISSLIRQHRLFSQGERRHPRALAYMRRSGHFEFGLDRRPMHLGNGERVREVMSAWADGDEVRGGAIYWDMVHGYLAELLSTDLAVRNAAQVVRFETLCANPAETLHAVLSHCDLPEAESVIARFAPGIRMPRYYESSFSPTDLDVVREKTEATARYFGY